MKEILWFPSPLPHPLLTSVFKSLWTSWQHPVHHNLRCHFHLPAPTADMYTITQMLQDSKSPWITVTTLHWSMTWISHHGKSCLLHSLPFFIFSEYFLWGRTFRGKGKEFLVFPIQGNWLTLHFLQASVLHFISSDLLLPLPIFRSSRLKAEAQLT